MGCCCSSQEGKTNEELGKPLLGSLNGSLNDSVVQVSGELPAVGSLNAGPSHDTPLPPSSRKQAAVPAITVPAQPADAASSLTQAAPPSSSTSALAQVGQAGSPPERARASRR